MTTEEYKKISHALNEMFLNIHSSLAKLESGLDISFEKYEEIIKKYEPS